MVTFNEGHKIARAHSAAARGNGSVKVAPLMQRLDYSMPEASPVDGVGGQKWRGYRLLGSVSPKEAIAGARAVGEPTPALGLWASGGYRRSISSTVPAGAAKPRSAALMFATRNRRKRLIVKLRRQARVRGRVTLAGATRSPRHRPYHARGAGGSPCPNGPSFGPGVGGTGLCTMLACDQSDALEGGLVAADVEDLALDTSHLGRIGKHHVAV